MWDTGQVSEDNDSQGQFQYNSMRYSTKLLPSKKQCRLFLKLYSCKASKNSLKDKKQLKNYIFKKIYRSLVRASVVFQPRQFPSSLHQAQQNKDSTPEYLQSRTQDSLFPTPC